MHAKAGDEAIQDQLKEGSQENELDGILEQRTEVRHFPRHPFAESCCLHDHPLRRANIIAVAKK
jgi:hypothetical protein